MIVLRVFKGKAFYFWFVVFFLLFNYILTGSAFSFTRIGLWSAHQNVTVSENYIRQGEIQLDSVNLALVNLQVGKGDYDKQYYLSKAVEYASSAQNLIETDIIMLLDSGMDKKVTFESHIKQMQLLLDNMQILGDEMRMIIDEKRTESISCQNQKSTADNNFFQGLQQNESALLKESLEQSLTNGPCYIKNRIVSNAYAATYDKMAFFEKVLQEKYNLLSNNQDIIIQNLRIFEVQNINQLMEISQELDRYRPGVGM